MKITNKYSLFLQFWLCLEFVFIISSCDKTPTPPPADNTPVDTAAKGIFICNEGNFQWGNASLGFLNTTTGNYQEDVFKSYNQKSLGDVLQSISIIDDKAYLVVNNSQKIEIIDLKSFKSVGTIKGFNSPRFLLMINNQKAYVSDLYENAVWIINPTLQQITGKIALNTWSEEMVLVNDKAYICGKKSSYVYVVNTLSDQITDSINIGYGAQNITLDKNNKIWVLTSGKSPVVPQLFCIKPGIGIEKSFNFSSADLPVRLITNTDKSKIYLINKDVYQLNITDNNFPSIPFINSNGKNFYALGLNPYTNDILVSDAKDYVQKSDVFIYDSLGNLKSNFKAEVNTTFFGSR